MVNLITARPTQPVTTCLKIHHRSGRFSRKRQGARPEKIGMSPEKTEIELVKIEKGDSSCAHQSAAKIAAN